MENFQRGVFLFHATNHIDMPSYIEEFAAKPEVSEISLSSNPPDGLGANLACSSSILKGMNSTAFALRPRDSCSAGASISPSCPGMIARCQAYWYDSPSSLFGNVMDEQVRSTIRENKSNYFL
jgi:hypothetical protein